MVERVEGEPPTFNIEHRMRKGTAPMAWAGASVSCAGMLMSVLNLVENERKSLARGSGLWSFDPRRWPPMVSMLVGLCGVSAALMTGPVEGGRATVVPSAATTRVVGKSSAEGRGE